jgi:2-dehydro-3-deoxygalactonokinase
VSHAETHLIALDWGTSSLRAYRFDAAGHVVESRQRAAGVMRVTAADSAAGGFERAFEEACGDWVTASPASPIVACGMIGSAQGWREAPYLEVPASVDALGHALTAVETSRGSVLHIIPGLLERGALPEVMRGEETQVAGALERAAQQPGSAGADLWIGLPGTHSKWVRVEDRRIVRFHTFLTGEVFAALCAHTILGRTMRAPAVPDDDAFDRGVAVARGPEARAGVLSNIFSARTLGLVGQLSAEAQADYLSGVLVGHELAALERLGARLEAVVLAGAADLCRRYQRALATFGAAASIAPDATERGLWRVAGAAGLVPRSAAC